MSEDESFSYDSIFAVSEVSPWGTFIHLDEALGEFGKDYRKFAQQREKLGTLFRYKLMELSRNREEVQAEVQSLRRRLRDLMKMTEVQQVEHERALAQFVASRGLSEFADIDSESKRTVHQLMFDLEQIRKGATEKENRVNQLDEAIGMSLASIERVRKCISLERRVLINIIDNDRKGVDAFHRYFQNVHRREFDSPDQHSSRSLSKLNRLRCELDDVQESFHVTLDEANKEHAMLNDIEYHLQLEKSTLVTVQSHTAAERSSLEATKLYIAKERESLEELALGARQRYAAELQESLIRHCLTRLTAKQKERKPRRSYRVAPYLETVGFFLLSAFLGKAFSPH